MQLFIKTKACILVCIGIRRSRAFRSIKLIAEKLHFEGIKLIRVFIIFIATLARIEP